MDAKTRERNGGKAEMTQHMTGQDGSAAENVIEVDSVTRRYGEKRALDEVSLKVPAGVVLGLVGENGAGKNTLITHILGLLSAQTGSVRVFGIDPVEYPVEVLAQIGYLSEEADLPNWMRVDELMRYAEAFYPTWDGDYAESLRLEFGLDLKSRLKNLSKGQRARAGLLVALAYRPPLLVLDEPSSGLDPIVRRDILGAIIRTIADEGRTVLFSSHLLGEVERVADRVAMIKSGRILFCDTLDAIKANHHRITLQLDAPRSEAPTIPGTLVWDGGGRDWTALCTGRREHLDAAATLAGGRVVEYASPSLDEIFLARSGASSGRTPEDAAV
jgi:ABC-2 type transport system ATP-binding protein